MSDNFDLRKFLIENRMTEQSRGSVRKHLGNIELNKHVILEEMDAEAEGDVEEGRKKKDVPTIKQPKVDVRADLYRQLISYQTRYGREKGTKIFYKIHPEAPSEEKLSPRFAKHNASVGGVQYTKGLNRYAKKDRSTDPSDKPSRGSNPDNYLNEEDEDSESLGENRRMGMAADPDQEYYDSEYDNNYEGFRREDDDDLDEAGYIDDNDDEDAYQEDDLDLSAGDSLTNRLSGKNRGARRAAERAMSTDSDLDGTEAEDFDDDVDSADMGDEEDDTEFQDPSELPADDNAAPEASASNLHYNPDTIEMQMDDDELSEYLQRFRRPAVAEKVLQRALDSAQSEANDSPGVSKLYLVLSNGFYRTTAFVSSNSRVIAIVRRDPSADTED